MTNPKCLQCITEYVILPDEEKTPERWGEVRDMVTLAPSWQQISPVPGQLVIALSTVPSCLEHLDVKQASPEELATKSGLILPVPVH
jgi:hypothetical protein